MGLKYLSKVQIQNGGKNVYRFQETIMADNDFIKVSENKKQM